MSKVVDRKFCCETSHCLSHRGEDQTLLSVGNCFIIFAPMLEMKQSDIPEGGDMKVA